VACCHGRRSRARQFKGGKRFLCAVGSDALRYGWFVLGSSGGCMNPAQTTLDGALKEALRPDASALLVIDMQNDFCAPGGYIDTVMGKDISAVAGICDNLKQLVQTARWRKSPVSWLAADYSHDRSPASMLRKLRQRGVTAVCCEPGSWGADWFCVRPDDGETVIVKHNYSGFSGT